MLDTMRGSSNESQKEQLFSLLNCALQDDELYKVIQVGTCWYWVSIESINWYCLCEVVLG